MGVWQVNLRVATDTIGLAECLLKHRIKGTSRGCLDMGMLGFHEFTTGTMEISRNCLVIKLGTWAGTTCMRGIAQRVGKHDSYDLTKARPTSCLTR